MEYLKKFNENNNGSLHVGGLKCDNPECNYSDMSVPLSDYESSINKPCPKCGESLLTQEDYDRVMQMVQAVEILNQYSEDDLNKILANLSEDEINGALDMMNQLKMKKKSDNEDGTKTWSIGESLVKNEIKNMKNLKNFEDFKVNESLSNEDRLSDFLNWLREKDFELYDGQSDLTNEFKSVSVENLSPEDKANRITDFLEEKWGLHDGYLETLNYLKNLFNK
jgi:hypothetical protein